MLILFDHGAPQGLARALPHPHHHHSQGERLGQAEQRRFVESGRSGGGRPFAHYRPENSIPAEPYRPSRTSNSDVNRVAPGSRIWHARIQYTPVDSMTTVLIPQSITHSAILFKSAVNVSNRRQTPRPRIRRDRSLTKLT